MTKKLSQMLFVWFITLHPEKLQPSQHQFLDVTKLYLHDFGNFDDFEALISTHQNLPVLELLLSTTHSAIVQIKITLKFSRWTLHSGQKKLWKRKV